MEPRGQYAPAFLIRELLETGREGNEEEVREILARIAEAPFAGRDIKVNLGLRGQVYLGHRFGLVAPSYLVHIGKRVLVDKQWRYGVTFEEYLYDLREAVRHENARLAVFVSHGLCRAAVLSPNLIPRDRLGDKMQPSLLVLYDADHDTLTSGYQVSGIRQVSLPEGVRWLR